MLSKVNASNLVRPVGNGKTKPYFITCETAGDDIDLIVKFSAACEQKERNLVAEAIAAMLAADLGLPVPEPFLVQIDDVFIRSITDSAIAKHIESSNRIAFGSAKLPEGFAAWTKHARIPKSLTNTAAEVLLFDAIIKNFDRRPVNPNCLRSSDAIGIIDHDTSLMDSELLLFWTAPWSEGGFDKICELDNHIFAPSNFEVKPVRLDRFEAAWTSLPGERFQQYCEALPFEWGNHDAYLERTVDYLNEVKSNISDVVLRGLEKLS